MHHSIKLKFFAAFTAVALVFIALISVLNLFFYDDYYMMERRRDLRSFYQETSAAYAGSLDSIYTRLLAAEEAQGVRLTVLSQSGLVVYDTTLRQLTADTPMNVPQLFGGSDSRNSFFTDFNITARALQEANPDRLSNEGCDIVTVVSGENEYLCLVGRLGENYLISRIAIAYMQTS